jgi:hypothetical protein
MPAISFGTGGSEFIWADNSERSPTQMSNGTIFFAPPHDYSFTTPFILLDNIGDQFVGLGGSVPQES